MKLAIALLPAGSLAVLRKEALPHVNDPPVHLVACVRVLGHVLDVFFIHSLMLDDVPGVLVLLAIILLSCWRIRGR